MTQPFARRAALAVSILASLAACSRGDTAADSAATANAGTTASDASGTTGAAPAAAPALNDAQIAHVAVSANAIDSTLGVLAASKAQSAEVKEFGRRMSNEHGQVNAQAVALATRLSVTPEDNDISRSLQQGATQSRDSLGALSGAAFDRAYIAREVGYHQAVLDALDNTLIPGAQNADLKKLLQDVRPAVAGHLALAKQIQGKLGTR